MIHKNKYPIHRICAALGPALSGNPDLMKIEEGKRRGGPGRCRFCIAPAVTGRRSIFENRNMPMPRRLPVAMPKRRPVGQNGRPDRGLRPFFALCGRPALFDLFLPIFRRVAPSRMRGSESQRAKGNVPLFSSVEKCYNRYILMDRRRGRPGVSLCCNIYSEGPPAAKRKEYSPFCRRPWRKTGKTPYCLCPSR